MEHDRVFDERMYVMVPERPFDVNRKDEQMFANGCLTSRSNIRTLSP